MCGCILPPLDGESKLDSADGNCEHRELGFLSRLKYTVPNTEIPP